MFTCAHCRLLPERSPSASSHGGRHSHPDIRSPNSTLDRRRRDEEAVRRKAELVSGIFHEFDFGRRNYSQFGLKLEFLDLSQKLFIRFDLNCVVIFITISFQGNEIYNYNHSICEQNLI